MEQTLYVATIEWGEWDEGSYPTVYLAVTDALARREAVKKIRSWWDEEVILQERYPDLAAAPDYTNDDEVMKWLTDLHDEPDCPFVSISSVEPVTE